MNKYQMNKLMNNTDNENGQKIRLRYKDLLEDDAQELFNLLQANQKKKFEKHRQKGVGIELHLKPDQINEYKKTVIQRRITPKNDEIKKEMSSEISQKIASEIFHNKKMRIFCNDLYDQYIRPLMKRPVPFDDGLYMMMLMSLMKNVEFMRGIPDIEKLSEKQLKRMARSIGATHFGKGKIGDFFNKVGRAIVSGLDSFGRVVVNTTEKMINKLNKIYSDPKKIISTLGKMIIGIATENPVLIGEVAGSVIDDIAEAGASGLKESIAQELGGKAGETFTQIADQITPSNIQKASDAIETIKGFL